MKIKGNNYRSQYTGLVVKCLEDTDHTIGEVLDTWVSDVFFIDEDNNGWTKLISEKDLPKEDGVYVVGNMDSFGNFKENENKTNLSWLVYQFSHKKITHYKLYISVPPKF